MLKNAEDKACKVMHRMIKLISQAKRLPPETSLWAWSLRRDLTECQNYKAITLLSTTHKITTSIVRKKLEDVYKGLMENYQYGFRKKKSILNLLFNLRFFAGKIVGIYSVVSPICRLQISIRWYHKERDVKNAWVIRAAGRTGAGV